jgi:hypothetical protein
MNFNKSSLSRKEKKQASQYDKIFKENIEAVVPGLISRLLHIQAVWSEEIPDDIQHTKERKPDVLKKIKDASDRTFVLQLEFQVANEPEMIYRMADYYLMLRRKYKIPVEQYVLFVGPDQPKMLTKLEEERMKFDFRLISFAQLDYELFLKSEKPEEVLLAILADFKQRNPEMVVRQVIDRIEATTQGDFSLKRYFQQLRVLAQLRSLETQIDKTMDSIAEYINEEKDVLYIRGERKGISKGNRKFVTYLLENTSQTVEQIARTADVSVAFVLELQSELSGKK